MNKLIGYAFLLCLSVVAIEICSYFLLRIDNVVPRSRMYRPPPVARAEFERYMDQRDPLLGWPTKDFIDIYTDADGARLSPANEKFQMGGVCIATYGDSFTYGAEVGNADAWGNVLAEMLRCQVKNYGVGGYGVDQAVLRFAANLRDKAEFVILGVHIDDINRNMNQWRYLLSGSAKELLNFKPIFTYKNTHGLLVVPNPVTSYDSLMQTFEAPSSTLIYEHYLPDLDQFKSLISVDFPYVWSLMNLIKRLMLEIKWANMLLSSRAGDWNYPAWYDTPGGPNPAKIQLNTRIVELFAQTCNEKARYCVVLFIPDAEWIRIYETLGSVWTETIVNPMKQYAEVWDPTEYFSVVSKRRGICYYYGRNRDCAGHFNEEGYALLADFVAQTLWSNGWRGSPGD